MKPIISISCFLFLFCGLWSQALLSGYSSSYSAATYSELSTGTVLGNVNSDEQYITNPAFLGGYSSMTSGPGLPIGFNFSFAGDSFDVVGIHVNGWISLGKSSLGANAVDMRSSTTTNPLSSTEGGQADPNLVARIAAAARNLQAQSGSSIMIAQSGTAPNRVLTVQWKNYRRYNVSGDSYNFQIQLIETDMRVSIVYGAMTSASAAAVQVGLRAAPATEASNFANLSIPFGTTWANAPAGTTATAFAYLSATQSPVSGATFSWMPPASLQPDFTANITSGTAPLTVQFTDLSVAGGNPISGWTWSFGAQSSSAQNPLFTFNNPGVYDVVLTITDGINNATKTKSAYITVLNGDIPGVNTTIQMDEEDAIVSWQPILMDGGQNPQYYFLYFNGSNDPAAEFYFLAPITYPATQYRHLGVGMGAQHMFYRVTAVRLD